MREQGSTESASTGLLSREIAGLPGGDVEEAHTVRPRGRTVCASGGPKFAELVVEWVAYIESGKEVANAFASYDSCRESLKNLLRGVVAR